MKTILRVVLLSLLAIFVFTTCDSPMGMGDEIDFEPPVLTLDPTPTPMYVRDGAQLSGTVTDNDVVDRVILRDSNTQVQLFTAVLLPNNRWEISLVFSDDQNGETILADVVAFDRAGNSGAESIASVVLIIDKRPPIVEDIWIQRSSTKTNDLEKYIVLKDLERSDPNGELSANINKYQNGAFNVKAKLSEKETRIDSLTLKIFDSDYPDTELLSLLPENNSSIFNPQWYVTEDMLLNAGNAAFPGSNYKDSYKNNKRYYYRLRISAIDKGGNESGISKDVESEVVIIEDQGYFCLWQQADFPKGILDPLVVGAGTDIVTIKGSSLPVEFFDDDKIEWAFAALFTKEQWEGEQEIASGVKLSGTDDNKFKTLQDRLLLGQPVYNWRYDASRAKSNPDSEPVVNLVSNPVDEKTYYLVTGNDPSDFGEFVVITLVKDQKQSPHIASEYPNIIKYRKYNVNLVDENAPLIVFDKVGGSPEENTFPTIDSAGNFKIFGYTLREDKGKQELNKVEKFRIAWIPFSIATENNISRVRTALGLLDALKDSDFPAGVQWWDISKSLTDPSAEWETIGITDFRKQSFEKTFNVLGGEDDLKSAYNNFTYNNGLENTTKLFIFFAEDNMGHQVYSQFYLLGNKTPPTIEIFDITDKLTMTSPPAPNVFDDDPDGNITEAYIAKRKTFNEDSYDDLKYVSHTLGEDDKADTYRAYPRGTIIKLWADAKTNGDLALVNIKMEDITYEKAVNAEYPKLGFYKDTDYALSYAEYFPEVTQRVFLFTAIDSLGNEAKVQRTIAIANAATLTSITTAEQNGTYPSGKTIEIKANFDGMIKLENNNAATKPKLNVIYKINSTYTVESITCEDVDNTNGQLSLVFKFNVPVNAQGRLETLYDGISYNPGSLDRPITVNPNNKILDLVREDAAYTPGNVTGFTWKTAAHSLQYDAANNKNGKNINLDGIIPKITGISFKDLKAPYQTTPTTLYYLKSGESISIELSADKPLKVSGNASLQFRLQRPNNTYTLYDTTHFEYRKVTGSSIIFTLDVNKANILNEDHGRLRDVSLYNGGNITDGPGNPIDTATFTSMLNSLLNAPEIYFDLVPPIRPVTTLEGTTITGTIPITVGSNPTETINYSTSPSLAIANIDTTAEPYGTKERQYSLDGGLNWVTFPTAVDADGQHWTITDAYNSLRILNGQWDLKTRFIDRAGNEGAETRQLINVNSKFPQLLAVKVSQPNATYIGNQSLEFTLDFDDVVTVAASGVTLTLRDLTSTTNVTGGTGLTYESPSIPATANAALNRTVKFTWNLGNNTKDMPNGLKVYALNVSGLKDKFGNSGPASVPAGNITASSITIPGGAEVDYNLSGIKVSTIQPSVITRVPATAYNRTGDITSSVSADNKTITLIFSKNIQKGNGNITIRPRAGYAIPAVFENDGYYIAYTYDGSGNVTGETRSSSAATGSTYVSGFYDIFNSINNVDKNTLIGSTQMSAPALSNVTGLSVGPYLKTTHGLTQGAGYTGFYGNTPAGQSVTVQLPGINAPGTRKNEIDNADGKNNFMIPDVETKWVLAYTYGDLFSTTGVVSNIRAVLDRAEFRWQKIAVTNTNVVIGGSGSTVTITLSEPLLPGLQWDVYYPEGTFTDTAGNKAVKSGNFDAAGNTTGVNNDYWFWSKGVQKPVIRVDRKSYDARAGGASANYSGSMFGAGQSYSANGYNGNNGINTFNTIEYRITSETPNARIEYGTKEGKSFTTGSGANEVTIGSILAKWTGRVTDQTLTNITNTANIQWNGPKTTPTETTGTWVRPNLIFRNTENGTYNIMEDGVNISKAVRGLQDTGNGFGSNANNNRFYGFRSYNKDATFKELDGVNPSTIFTAGGTDSFEYNSLEASKNYVVAQARIDHTNTGGTYNSANAVSSQKGFEGVFRTLIALNQTGLIAAGSNGASNIIKGSMGNNGAIATNGNPIMLDGSNVRSGMPTISGFPVRDNGCDSDSRYTKVFYRIESTDSTLGTNGKQFYWVTSEIISPWYVQPFGKGNGAGSHGSTGDVEDWITAGYGDLTYILNWATW